LPRSRKKRTKIKRILYKKEKVRRRRGKAFQARSKGDRCWETENLPKKSVEGGATPVPVKGKG